MRIIIINLFFSMKSVNMHILLGNVTKDPIMKEMAQGTKLATFCVATNHLYKWANGEQQDQAEYTWCVAWWKTAEIIEQYVHKGKEVHIIGRTQTRTWDTPEGQKASRTETVVEQITLLWGKDR